MKKKTFGLLLLMVLIAGIIITGCSNDSDDVSTTMSMVTWANTFRSSSTTQNLLIGFGCSDSDISGLGTRTLTLPSNVSLSMSSLSGSYTAQHFYVGSSTADLGSMSDPHYESTQRQFSTGNYTSATTLNGTYTGTLGDKSKSFSFTQTGFMTALSENDVTLGSGGTAFDVTNGDTIILSNQTNTAYRYYCVIYNNALSDTTTENIWASADIRKIDYVDTDDLEDFLLNDTVAPVSGVVTFTVPGGILTAGTNKVRVDIYAVNTSTLNSDTTGDFRTIVIATSEIILDYNGQ